MQRILSVEQRLLVRLVSSLTAHAPRREAVESLLDDLRHADLLRAVAVDAAAAELGIEPGPTLAELAAAAPPERADDLRARREVLRRLAAAEGAEGRRVVGPSLADFLR